MGIWAFAAIALENFQLPSELPIDNQLYSAARWALDERSKRRVREGTKEF